MSDERSPNAVDTRLGQKVRARRLEIGMSQEQLAELLGVTFQQVQKYEKGVNRIAASRLFEIAHALKMPIAQFFQGVRPESDRGKGTEEHIASALATNEGAQLVALFGSIKSRTIRRRVVDLVRVLSEGDSA